MKTVHLEYFAVLREEAGMSQEPYTTEAKTVGLLYEELYARYHFTLPIDKIKVAVNDEFVSIDSLLNDQDRVVFIPPVSGG